MTARQKWENYWYHYKWHTVLALALVFTLAVAVTQCARRPRYDLGGVLLCGQTLPADGVQALTSALSERTADYDQNGERAFEVYDLSYNMTGGAENPVGVTNSQKLLAVVSAADFVLYLVDDEGYDRLMQDNMRLFEAYAFLPDKNGTAWDWQGSALQRQLAADGLPAHLYFCIRKVKNTAAEDDDALARAERAAEWIQSLMEE